MKEQRTYEHNLEKFLDRAATKEGRRRKLKKVKGWKKPEEEKPQDEVTKPIYRRPRREQQYF